jgi:hypothetical protein
MREIENHHSNSTVEIAEEKFHKRMLKLIGEKLRSMIFNYLKRISS